MPLCRGRAFWSFIQKPDVKFEPVYRITIQMEDDEAAKLKAVGLKVRRNDDGVFEYKFKRNVTNKKTGAPNPVPKQVDANREPVDSIIGNGSDVVVQYATYNWEYKGKKGTNADFQAVQVINLIPYGDGKVSERLPDGEEFSQMSTTEGVSQSPPTTVDEY